MHLVGYLYEDCHDARSLEHKVHIFTETLTAAEVRVFWNVWMSRMVSIERSEGCTLFQKVSKWLPGNTVKYLVRIRNSYKIVVIL